MPLILRFPAGVRPRRVPDQVRLIDIAPTVLDYLRIDTEASFEGKNLLPLARGEDEAGAVRPAFAFVGHPGRPWKATAFSLRDNGFKLIWQPAMWVGYVRNLPREELYNVYADPEENENILAQEPSVLPDLRQRLTRWREQGIPDSPEPTGEIRTILKSLGYVQ